MSGSTAAGKNLSGLAGDTNSMGDTKYADMFGRINQLRLLIISIFIGLSLLATRAGASEFDCHKAAIPSDFVICSEPDLLAANDQLSAAWRDLRIELNESGKNVFLKQQRTWIKDLNTSCGLEQSGAPILIDIIRSRPCILHGLQTRTAVLEHFVKAHQVPQNFLLPGNVGINTVLPTDDKAGSGMKHPFYKLVMSRDDKVCHALGPLYNSFATRKLSDDNPEGLNIPPPENPWEDAFADEFAWAGFHKPPPAPPNDPEDTGDDDTSSADTNANRTKPWNFTTAGVDTLYYGDVLGDGKPRYFSQMLDFEGGGSETIFEIYVFKRHELPQERYFPNLEGESSGYFLDPDAVDFFVDFYRTNPHFFPEEIGRGKDLGMTAASDRGDEIYYKLKYWDVSKIGKILGPTFKSKETPELSMNVIQYPYYYDGQYYMNENDDGLYTYDHKGEFIFTARANWLNGHPVNSDDIIFVYKLTPDRTIDDLCYFYHPPE